jgi:alpha/beta superfamily hydrolase
MTEPQRNRKRMETTMPAHAMLAAATASAADPQSVALRTDEHEALTEEARFIESEGEGVFAFLHQPLEESLSGVIICPPLEAETIRHYRKEVLLGRALAARGHAAVRFNYRGTGNSDGEGSEVTFDDMARDALTVADWLRERTGVERIAFLGTRWGALVAANAARRGSAPLALWEPVVSAASYFRETLRWRLMHDIKYLEPSADRPTTQGLIEQMREHGSVDVMGYPVHWSLYSSSSERTLQEEVGTDPRQILLVQLSLERELRAEYRRLLEAWTVSGLDVRSELITDEVAWRFQVVRWAAEEDRPETDRLLSTTTAWLEGHLGGRA